MVAREVKRVIGVSTFPDTQCGIAVFNTDTINSLKCNGLKDVVNIPLFDGVGNHAKWVQENFGIGIDRNKPQDFIRAAEFINGIYRPGDVILAQHEYGIWAPHHEQDCAVSFISTLSENIPVAYIFHTLFTGENEQKDAIIRDLQKRINLGIGLTPTALKLLKDKYGFRENQAEYIPHGVPDTVILESKYDLKRAKGLLNVDGSERRTTTTIGFLARGKGLEYGIEGTTVFRNRNPEGNPIHIIEGETPPGAYKKSGHEYIYECIDLATSLGNRIRLMSKKNDYPKAKERFTDNPLVDVVRYEASRKEMKDNPQYFRGIDLAITPRYLQTEEVLREVETGDLSLVTNSDPDQVCSGQIFWYTSRGGVVAATPSPCAKDFYNQGMLLLMDFKNPESVADTIEHFYNNPAEMNKIRTTATKGSKAYAWSNVGHRTLDALDVIVETA